MVVFINILLVAEGYTGEAWEPYQNLAVSQTVEHWLEKYFKFFCSHQRVKDLTGPQYYISDTGGSVECM